jgi:hypothetical protein
MLLDIYWSFRTALFFMVGNDTFAHVINAIASNFNLILVSSNTHKRSQSMTNRVCTHTTCISRVQASVLAICRFVGTGGDQNP